MTTRRCRNDDGFMGVAVMAASGFLFIILAGLTLLISKGVQDSNRSTARAEARGVAESAAEELFSRTLTNPDYFVDGAPANYTTHPASEADSWWRFDKTNTLVRCAPSDRRVACYQMRLTPAAANPTSLSATFVGTSRCKNDNRTNCDGTVNYRINLRRRSFLEFVLHADSEALDAATIPINQYPSYPASGCDTRAEDRTAAQLACLDAVYQGATGFESDIVSGPIHSNDSRIVICGQPRFTDIIEVADATGVGWEPAAKPGCTNNAPNGGTFVSGPDLLLPFQRPDDPTTVEDEAAEYNPFALARVIAEDDGNPATNPYVFPPGPPTNLQILPGAIRVNATTMRFPDSGVIYFQGPVNVSGTLNGRLSIVSESNIRIVGDLTYACAASGTIVPPDCNDALGLNALESIIIEYAPEDRTIHAAMAAVNHSIFVDEWLTADRDLVCARPGFAARGLCVGAVDGPDLDTIPELPRVPVLTIDGAIVGHYRGVYGAYDEGEGDIPTGTEGRLVSGFSKNFRYDTRLKNSIQPPYFVSPVSAAWQKIDEVETLGGAVRDVAPTTVPPTTTTTAPVCALLPFLCPTTTTTTIPGGGTTTTTLPPTTTTTAAPVCTLLPFLCPTTTTTTTTIPGGGGSTTVPPTTTTTMNPNPACNLLPWLCPTTTTTQSPGTTATTQPTTTTTKPNGVCTLLPWLC